MECKKCGREVYGRQIQAGTGMCKQCYTMPVAGYEEVKKKWWEFWK